MFSTSDGSWNSFDEMLADSADPTLCTVAEMYMEKGLEDSDLVNELSKFTRLMHPGCPRRRTDELTRVCKWIARKRRLDGAA